MTNGNENLYIEHLLSLLSCFLRSDFVIIYLSLFFLVGLSIYAIWDAAKKIRLFIRNKEEIGGFRIFFSIYTVIACLVVLYGAVLVHNVPPEKEQIETIDKKLSEIRQSDEISQSRKDAFLKKFSNEFRFLSKDGEITAAEADHLLCMLERMEKEIEIIKKAALRVNGDKAASAISEWLSSEQNLSLTNLKKKGGK